MTFNLDAFGLPMHNYGYGTVRREPARTNAEQLRYLAGLVGNPGNFWDPSIKNRLTEMADELEKQEKVGDDWLQIGSAKKHLQEVSDQIGYLRKYLDATQKRFTDFSEKELKKPDGELSQLRRRHESLQKTHSAEILEITAKVEANARVYEAMRMKNEEQATQIQRLVETIGRRSRAHKSTILQAKGQAVRADALQAKLDEVQADLDDLSKAVVTKLIPHQQARAAAPADNDTFALQAAISMEHAAVPNHGRLTGRSACWDGCGCAAKPKVCRVCRTHTGALIPAPCRTAQIATGE